MSRPPKKTGKARAQETGEVVSDKASEERAGRPARPRGADAPGETGTSGVSDNAGKTPGFAESPQRGLEGSPLDEGALADWMAQVEREAETVDRDAEMSRIRSEAGKHRVKVARQARKHAEQNALRKNTATHKSSRGTSMGATSDPKARAAGGLNPVAGLDISLEEAETLTNSGVQATDNALQSLLNAGDPNINKDLADWVPHRPARPEKSEGGVPIRMVTDYKPAGDQPTAIADLVEGISSDEKSQVGNPAPGADPRAKQDPGRPALRGVQAVLPGQCGGIFRLLLRLLPARGLCAALGHLYRKGVQRKRADRPHAPRRHPLPAGAR